MIENAALESILSTATDISIVCEIYDSDTVPTDDGFDPADALDRFANIGDAGGTITFLGEEYKRLVTKFGNIKRTITKEINTASVTFSNVSREISDFEFTHGFEGLILVIRLLSRSRSTALDETQILFTGRCDKPESGDKKALTVTAKFILGSIEITLPRRKFGPEDHEGRVQSDPEFEGFPIMPQTGTTSYSVRKRNPWGLLAGVVGFFLFHKTVKKTLNWSSYSDVDANKSVPEVFGRAQMLGTHLGYADVGDHLRVRTAFCEGEIEDIVNARSTDTTLPIGSTAYLMGLVGTANGPDDPDIPSPGYYSRTAYMRCLILNSDMAETDPAPDIAAIILGRKMMTPGEDGVWDEYAWTDNAAAHTRFLLTDENYQNLDPAWIDDDYLLECFRYNEEMILNTSITDFLFVEEG